jgi:hypothetical protein
MSKSVTLVIIIIILIINGLGREADQSPRSSAEVKNDGAISPLSHMTSRYSAQLVNNATTLSLNKLVLSYSISKKRVMTDVRGYLSWYQSFVILAIGKL